MNDWNMYLLAVGPAGSGAVSEGMLQDFHERIPLPGRSTGGGNDRYTARFYVTASAITEAVEAAVEAFRTAAAEAGMPDWPLRQVEAVHEDEDLALALADGSLPEMWRTGDIADHLGVSEARADDLTRRDGFPPPFGTTPFTRIWAADDIREFLDSRAARREAPV